MFDFMLNEQEIALRDTARDYVKTVPKELLVKMDNDEVKYPREYVVGLAENHLLGIRFSQEYGGHGLGWTAEVPVLGEIGALSLALGCLFSLPSICGEALDKYGTPEQKEKYLRPTIEGKIFTAEALTEPRGGSDFFGATTTAVRDGDEYILNGQKRFVVGAEGADYFLVYAKTDPEAPPHKSISLFIVDRGEGVTAKYLYKLMGTRGGGAGRLVFRDVRVPADNVILEEGAGGKIFYQMMIPERMTSAAGCLGMMRGVTELAAKYATKRQAFGKAIKEYEAVSFKIADNLVLWDAAQAMCYQTAKAIDSGADAGLCRRLVSETKRFCTEQAWTCINNAMQVVGGISYTSVYPLEKFLRDARLASIWTGTSEIMNLIIQHEYYTQLAGESPWRDVEADAENADAEDEKIYE